MLAADVVALLLILPPSWRKGQSLGAHACPALPSQPPTCFLPSQPPTCFLPCCPSDALHPALD